jgi:hypothetical protein
MANMKLSRKYKIARSTESYDDEFMNGAESTAYAGNPHQQAFLCLSPAMLGQETGTTRGTSAKKLTVVVKAQVILDSSTPLAATPRKEVSANHVLNQSPLP